MIFPTKASLRWRSSGPQCNVMYTILRYKYNMEKTVVGKFGASLLGQRQMEASTEIQTWEKRRVPWV